MSWPRRKYPPLEVRFWASVDKRGPDDCWLWKAGTSHGYGVISGSTAHRVSWIIHNGSIPDGNDYHGICVLHSCDVRGCVNPAHLFLETNADNVDDKVAKGRASATRGEENGCAKLTAQDIRNIRDVYADGAVSQVGLAKFYGVSGNAIHQIVRRKSWAWL